MSLYTRHIQEVFIPLVSDMRKHEFDIYRQGIINCIISLHKPWQVIEYSFDGYFPKAVYFFTKKLAEQYVMLKMLEQ